MSNNHRTDEGSADNTCRHDSQRNLVEDLTHDSEVLIDSGAGDYWRANLRLLAWLLGIWFLVSFGGSIVFANALDQLRISGFPVGFWFAQQGGIYVFVILIFIYVWRIGKIDKAFGVDDTDHSTDQAP